MKLVGWIEFKIKTAGAKALAKEIRRKSMENVYTNELRKLVAEFPNRSAWKRGVKEYTDELLDNLEENAQYYERLPRNEKELKEWLLNGAMDWEDYSYGGCSLIYDGDIAERLCTPSELKKKDGGRLAPNSQESWLDVQTRALRQASIRIKIKFRLLKNVTD